MKNKTMILAASIAATLAVNAADAWILANSEGTSNCAWSNAVEFVEGKAEVTDNTLKPSGHSETQSPVMIKVKTSFSVSAADDEAPEGGAQAAVRLTNDGFQVWTKDGEGVLVWRTVTADGLVPEDDAEYELTLKLDYEALTYSVSVGGSKLKADGEESFAMATVGDKNLSEIGFVGTTQFTSLVGWQGDFPQEGFAAGDVVTVDGKEVALTEAQAAWLNGLGASGSAFDLSEEQFKKACLLNLDITEEGWDDYLFSVTGFTVYSDRVEVGVTLTRNNAAAIYGTLKFYAESTLEALKTATTPAATSDVKFEGEGNESTTVELPLEGETKPSFFKAVIE